MNAADFGDLLLENIRLFRQHPGVLRQYQERFKFILVDEYQDTNVAQYLWLQAAGADALDPPLAVVSGTPPKLRLPGSSATALSLIRRPARSASRRRGRDMTSLIFDPPRNSEKTSAASAMTTSRSMAGVGRKWTTSCASIMTSLAPRLFAWSETTAPPGTSSRPPRHLISHNQGRLGKTLRTEDVLGEKVQVTGAWDSEEEARAIGEEIEQLQREARERGEDHPLDEIAILVRASFQMREFEDRFITARPALSRDRRPALL